MKSGSCRLIGGWAFAWAVIAIGCSDDGSGTPGGAAGTSTIPSGGTSGAAGTAGIAGSAGMGTGGIASGGVGGAGSIGGMTGGAAGTLAGVGGAAGADVAPPMCTTPDDKQSGAACGDQVEGVYAIKTHVDVWWQDDANPPLVDPGRDHITVYQLASITDVCADGSEASGTLKVCGVELPYFKSDVNCDVFQIVLPDTLWDLPTMPIFPAKAHLTGFGAADTFTFDPGVGLLGFDLMDSELNGTWPTTSDATTCEAGSVESCFPDHDGDGNPGITVKLDRVGEELSPDGCGGLNLPFVFRGAPINSLGALVDDGAKAETVYAGLRASIGGASCSLGADCKGGTGDGHALYLDSRVIGCKTKVPGPGQPETECEVTEGAYVDNAAPHWNILMAGEHPPDTVTLPATQGGGPIDQTPSPGPKTAIVRLGAADASFTCADARAAAFPAL